MMVFNIVIAIFDKSFIHVKLPILTRLQITTLHNQTRRDNHLRCRLAHE